MSGGKLLVYLLRRDLRVTDNPILHHLASTHEHGFTHLLPVYVFPSNQIEISGFLKDGEKSPYPPARSQVGKFWRCGPQRAKFVAESVWDLKNNLESLSSGLVVRAGNAGDVLDHLIKSFEVSNQKVGAVWMTEEPAYEEVQEQNQVSNVCSSHGVDFKLWQDEKYYVDDRDNGLRKHSDLPDVFTTYRKSQEPLRERPRRALPRPDLSFLPSLPDHVPPPEHPFVMSESLEDLRSRLLKPLEGSFVKDPPPNPEGAESAHPFKGGETAGMERLRQLITSGEATAYKETRNGLLGFAFSTKLSAFLALGSLTARQVHEELLGFEDGRKSQYSQGRGYGQGENEGTRAIRFELLWRDYMRLCTKKFGRRLFGLHGFRQAEGYSKKWNTASQGSENKNQDIAPEKVERQLQRFLNGTTGMGLIDASQRELYHTGYTSNRARQNVASFLAKHLGIDWRYGAEWYEMMLIDYDVSSNWSNWQYVSGVGNDPRGDARTFNPVKQAFDYDKEARYVRTWVPELRDLSRSENIFQLCTTPADELEKQGLSDSIMATQPLKRIEFTVEPVPRGNRRAFPRRRGDGRGGRGGGGHNSGGAQWRRGEHQSNGTWNGNRTNGSGGTASSNDSASGDNVNSRQEANHTPRRGRGYGFPRGNGASHGYGRGSGFGNPQTSGWNGRYNGYSNGGFYHNGFANYSGYASPVAWHGGWNAEGGHNPYNNNGYSGDGNGVQQSWGYRGERQGGGNRGSYSQGQAYYHQQSPPHYVPAPAYMQMPPHIGPTA